MKPKNDRKVYALTKAGKEAAASVQANPKPSAVSESAAWGIPSWVDLNGELPKSLLNLSRVSFEVSKSGSKEQQSEAAKVIDEARRKIHLILSAE
jgi:DNA-binding PadR family transcriptional regulator